MFLETVGILPVQLKSLLKDVGGVSPAASLETSQEVPSRLAAVLTAAGISHQRGLCDAAVKDSLVKTSGACLLT